MEEQVDKIIEALDELDAEEAGMVLAAVVASFLEAVTDNPFVELAAFNQGVAILLAGEDEEAVH